MATQYCWIPSKKDITQSNIHNMMVKNNFSDFKSFQQWSVESYKDFWAQTVNNLNIPFKTNYQSIVNLKNGVAQAHWLYGAELNIAEACFQNHPESTAVIFQKENGVIQKVSQQNLEILVNRIANGLVNYGLQQGDVIAIDMPMTLEAVAIYLAGLKAGMPVATIADSFTEKEIAVRLKITQPKLIFTQDVLSRAGKILPLYQKVKNAQAGKTIVISTQTPQLPLNKSDECWEDFISENTHFDAVTLKPEDTSTILFSSGTTGTPKAIPWTQVTPIKSASDAYYHHNIQKNDVVCWPTNLGWMMGPWLVFAALINKATLALYYGAPLDKAFGTFVQEAQITMLGLVPSIVRHWKNSGCMEKLDWGAIKCFSSTGEVSNAEEMTYLMQLGGHKPVIEYCGGTEIGGGYITSTVIQPNYPSTFSCQALGGSFVLLNENHEPDVLGEVFIIPPILGLSNRLINKNHHDVYYKDTPQYRGKVLRRHGDAMNRLPNGYYVAQGRVDDAMNLGGIKVSGIQIEELINSLDFVKESAAIAVSPKNGGPSKLVLYYVSHPNNLSAEERLTHAKSIIRQELNPLFKVSDLIELDLLPRTASGKVMRRTLRDLYLSNH